MASKKTNKLSHVIVWILVILLLIGGIAVILKLTNNGTDSFKTFLVERDGKIYATTDKETLEEYAEVRFDVKYVFDVVNDESKDFSVKVVSNSDSETAFEYTVDGDLYFYKDGMDLTKAFGVEKHVEDGYFTITMPRDMLSVLSEIYDGTVELESEPDMLRDCYFRLLVTSYNEQSTIKILLYLADFTIDSIELDSYSIIF